MISKDLFTKRAKEAVGKMFSSVTTDAERVAQLEQENKELKGQLAVCELQLFNTTTCAQNLLMQKDEEIARLTQGVRFLSPYQYGPSLPWSKS